MVIDKKSAVLSHDEPLCKIGRLLISYKTSTAKRVVLGMFLSILISEDDRIES